MARGTGKDLVSLDDVDGSIAVVGSQLPDPADDPGNLPDDEELNAPDSALLETLAHLGDAEQSAANCIVYRITNGEEEYLYKCTALEFARGGGVEVIKQKFGPGDYRIRVYKGGKIYTHKRVKIGAPIIPDNQPGKDIVELRAEMARNNDRIGMALEKLAAAPRQDGLRERLEELKLLQSLFQPPSAPASAVSQISELKNLLGIVRDFAADGSEKPGSLMRLAERYAPQVLDILKEAKPQTAQALPPPAAADVAAQPVETSNAQPSGDNVNMIQMAKLKFALNFLCERAAQDNDPATYAEMACDMVSESNLRALLDRDDWIPELKKVEPKVENFLQWFALLRGEIFDVLRGNGVKLSVDGGGDTLKGAQSAGA